MAIDGGRHGAHDAVKNIRQAGQTLDLGCVFVRQHEGRIYALSLGQVVGFDHRGKYRETEDKHTNKTTRKKREGIERKIITPEREKDR